MYYDWTKMPDILKNISLCKDSINVVTVGRHKFMIVLAGQWDRWWICWYMDYGGRPVIREYSKLRHGKHTLWTFMVSCHCFGGDVSIEKMPRPIVFGKERSPWEYGGYFNKKSCKSCTEYNCLWDIVYWNSLTKGNQFEGFVYFVQCKDTKRIKIGYSKNPNKRIYDMNIGSSGELNLLAKIPGNIDLEEIIHRSMNHYNVKGEWYAPNDELIGCIKRIIEYQKDVEMKGV
jgi:hypothetical protein